MESGRFEVIEHTADAGIRAYGASMAGAFEACARGMMHLMFELEEIAAEERVRLEAGGRDPASLLVAWLGEILFRVEAEGWAFSDFDVTGLSETRVEGWGYGEPIDPRRHELKAEIKAPTYHMLELREEGGRWTAQVVFDI